MSGAEVWVRVPALAVCEGFDLSDTRSEREKELRVLDHATGELGARIVAHLAASGQLAIDKRRSAARQSLEIEVKVAGEDRPGGVTLTPPPPHGADVKPAPDRTDALKELEEWADELGPNMLGEASGRLVLGMLRTQIERLRKEAENAKPVAAPVDETAEKMRQWQAMMAAAMQNTPAWAPPTLNPLPQPVKRTGYSEAFDRDMKGIRDLVSADMARIERQALLGAQYDPNLQDNPNANPKHPRKSDAPTELAAMQSAKDRAFQQRLDRFLAGTGIKKPDHKGPITNAS